MVNDGRWDAGASSTSGSLNGGQFGTNTYQTAKRRFVVVSNSGMSIRDMTGTSGTVYQGGSMTNPAWVLSDFVVDAWGHYRHSGSKADYNFALTVLRFSGGKSGFPSETIAQLTGMP